MIHKVIIHAQAYQNLTRHAARIQAGTIEIGAYLRKLLINTEPSALNAEVLLNLLLQTKLPQIFAESQVLGDGTDWSLAELKLLGDIGVACLVTIYDDGRHQKPSIHESVFTGQLLFTPGALLRNDLGKTPADWDVVDADGRIDPEAYYQLYLHRLLPLLRHADQTAGQRNAKAFITVPGLGCGQFAGPFQGQLGLALQQVLQRLLAAHAESLPNISAVYYDPYQECRNEHFTYAHLDLWVRPLAQNHGQFPQLSHPRLFSQGSRDYSQCLLFSVVAWDHVSWPGNDFYLGARITDDGVKAAATDVMSCLTGIPGEYDKSNHKYQPPHPYRNWLDVVVANQIELSGGDQVLVFA